MFDLLFKGGPIMWPLLATSLVAVSVVVERLLFILAEKAKTMKSQRCATK